MTTGFVIAATGLKAEARIAERSDFVKAIVGGGDEKRLASLIAQSLVDGPHGIISFGIAGGLRPGLASGTIVVGTSVVHGGETYLADVPWSDRLFEALPNAESGAIAGSNTIVAEPDQKRALYMSTGAFAADMESHVVARIAAKHRVPFAVLRVIADSSEPTAPACRGQRPEPGRHAEHRRRAEVIGCPPDSALGLAANSRCNAARYEGITPLPPASGPGPRLR